MDEKVRVHIIVSGRVQGVYFRNHTQKQAIKLNVSGWVKNLEDGRVEAMFEGEKEQVEKMINWAQRGPLFARVKELKVERQDYRGEFDSFEIKY